MPVPPLPMTHFIFIQPDLLFSEFKGFFHPALGFLPPVRLAPSAPFLGQRRSNRRSRWGQRDCAGQATTASTPLRSSGKKAPARPNRRNAALDSPLLLISAATSRQANSPRLHRRDGSVQCAGSLARLTHRAADAPPACYAVCSPHHRPYRLSPRPLLLPGP